MTVLKEVEITWGDRLRRMRLEAGYKSQERAASVLSDLFPVTGATLSRLEDRGDTPTDPRQRRTAYLACILYGYDPALLGLDEDDLPELLREMATKELSTQGRGGSTWMSLFAPQAPFPEAAGF